jgi:PPP family 3-phenylpropionic acid transporter
MSALTELATSKSGRLTLMLALWLCAWGMTTPFLTRFLAVERGLSGVEIGAVMGAAQLLRIVTGPALAAWADGFPDRRTPLRLLILASLVSYGLFLLVGRGFGALLILSFIAATIAQAVGPLLEGAILRASQDGGLPFGAARGVGSAMFIVGNIGGGALIAAIGLIAVPIWVLAALAAITIASFIWPLPDPIMRAEGGFRSRLWAGLRAARAPVIARVIAAGSLIQAGHAFYYAFAALVWRAQGISAATVGLLWSIGIVVEVGFLFLLPRIERFVGPETLMRVSAVAGIARWSALAFAPTGWMLWPIQTLHALSFSPAHIGALRIIQREAPEEHSVFLQTLYAALHAGLIMGLATMASGWLYDHVWAGGYWAMVGSCVAGLIVAARLRA